MTEAQKRATKKYSEKIKRYYLDCYPTEADIIAKLEHEKANGGYATYIKKLIRKDIEQ